MRRGWLLAGITSTLVLIAASFPYVVTPRIIQGAWQLQGSDDIWSLAYSGSTVLSAGRDGTVSAVYLTGNPAYTQLTPAQITSAQNNYAPGFCGTATVWRLSSDASRSITGIDASTCGGTLQSIYGKVLTLANVGANPIVLEDEDAGSSAANRFALAADVTLAPGTAITLTYDITSSRWRPTTPEPASFTDTLGPDGDKGDAVIGGSGTTIEVEQADALETDGTNCAVGEAARGVDTAGNAQDCFTPAGTVADGDKGDISVSGGVWSVDADAVALATDTTGAYVAGITGGLGLSSSGGGAENATVTLGFDTTAALSGDHALSAGEGKFGTSGLIFEGSAADTFETYVSVTNPTADRTVTIPNADSTTVQPDAGASNNFLTAISTSGAISKAQPAFTNLSGTASDAQVDGSLEADEVNPTLGTQTQGNYVASVATTGPLSGGAAGSEGATLTLTTSMSASRLIGRTTAGTGVMEEITVASPLTFSAGTLDITNIADGDVSDTLTASIFKGSGTSTDAVDLGTAEVSGTLGATNGGTGQSTWTQGDLMYSSGANTLAKLGAGTAGQMLSTGGAGANPAWSGSWMQATLGPFSINDLPGTATTQATLGYFNTATAVSRSTNDVKMGAAVHIIGAFITSDAARTGGTATVQPRVNGSATAFNSGAVVLNATNTTSMSSMVLPASGIAVTSGQTVGCAVVTSSWTPTTADIDCWIVVSWD